VQVWNIYEAMSTRRFIDAPDQAAHPKPRATGKIAPLCAQLKVAAAWNATKTHIIAADPDGNVAVFAGKKPVSTVGKPSAIRPPSVPWPLTKRWQDSPSPPGGIRSSACGMSTTGEGLAAMPHNSFVEVIALAPDDETLATFTEKGDMRVWRFRTGEGSHARHPPRHRLRAGRVSEDGKEVLFRLEKLGWFTMPMPSAARRACRSGSSALPKPSPGTASPPPAASKSSISPSHEDALTDRPIKEAKGSGRGLTPRPLARSPIRPSARSIRNPIQPLPDYLKTLEANPAAAEELKRFQAAK
jgi:hypothetical protein